MIPTTLEISVGPREEVREDALRVARAIDESEPGEKPAVPDHLKDRSVLRFGSYDDLVDSITPTRLELLRALVAHEPNSMRGTARLVDRDVSDVHGDLTHLEALGVLEFEEGGRGGAKRPVVPYERIEMHIDYPLVDSDGDEAAVNAD